MDQIRKDGKKLVYTVHEIIIPNPTVDSNLCLVTFTCYGIKLFYSLLFLVLCCVSVNHLIVFSRFP